MRIPKPETPIIRLAWRAWKYRCGRNRKEVELLRRLIQPGDTVIDAGAHKGAFTWWMRAATGSTGDVVAFEPQPNLARDLSACAAALEWNNVRVIPAALSNSGGTGTLHIPSTGSPGASLVSPATACDQGLAVPLCALDDWLEINDGLPPTFLKIDCEGHELRILQGATKCIEAATPTLLIELERRHMGHADMDEVFTMLGELGYLSWFFHRHRLRTIDEFSLTQHQREVPGSAFWKHPDYSNNFLFRHQSLDACPAIPPASASLRRIE